MHTYQTCCSTKCLTNPLVLARPLLHIMNQYTKYDYVICKRHGYKPTNGVIAPVVVVAAVVMAVSGANNARGLLQW